jgi:DNA-binding phage protein
MNNIIAPTVEVAYVGGGGEDGNDLYRGVKATADIRSEDDLVRLPRAACMLVIEGQENPHEEYISNELWAKAGDERWALRVALVLLYEKSLGRQSKFYEYIEQLPKSFENLGTWTEGEVRELQYSVGEKFAKEQRMENEKACELIQNYARDGLKTTAEEEVIWALDVVRSRVFSGKLADQAAMQRKLLPRALSGGTVFASFLTAQTTEL